MPSFALITEGLTDQIVVENVLVGYFDNPNILVNPLLPLRDETDKHTAQNHSNWFKVLEFCSSENFRGAFLYNDYVVVQIDTDICIEYNVSSRDQAGDELDPVQLVHAVESEIIRRIGESFFQQHEEQIIFAVSVHSIECWMLPLYYTDNRKSKTKSCLETLNRELNKKENFSIDPEAKRPEYYEAISRKYATQKTLLKFCNHNPSLALFVGRLERLL